MQIHDKVGRLEFRRVSVGDFAIGQREAVRGTFRPRDSRVVESHAWWCRRIARLAAMEAAGTAAIMPQRGLRIDARMLAAGRQRPTFVQGNPLVSPAKKSRLHPDVTPVEIIHFATGVGTFPGRRRRFGNDSNEIHHLFLCWEKASRWRPSLKLFLVV